MTNRVDEELFPRTILPRRHFLQMLGLTTLAGFSSSSRMLSSEEIKGREIFWFVQVSDPHVSMGNGREQPGAMERLSRMVREIRERVSPSLVVWTGDISDGGRVANAAIRADYESFLETTSKLDCAQVVIGGNHDKQEIFTEYWNCHTRKTTKNLTLQAISTWNVPGGGSEIEREVLRKMADSVNVGSGQITVTATHHPPGQWDTTVLAQREINKKIPPTIRNTDSFLETCQEIHSRVHLAGHFHRYPQIVRGEPTILQTVNPRRGYSIIASDGVNVGVAPQTTGNQPIVVILSPQRQEVSQGALSTVMKGFHVKALVFSTKKIVSVRCRLADDDWFPLEKGEENLFEGLYTSSRTDDGGCFFSVEALDSEGRVGRQAIPTALNTNGDYEERVIVPLGDNWIYHPETLFDWSEGIFREEMGDWHSLQYDHLSNPMWFEAALRPPARFLLCRFALHKRIRNPVLRVLAGGSRIKKIYLNGLETAPINSLKSPGGGLELVIERDLSQGFHLLSVELDSPSPFEAELIDSA